MTTIGPHAALQRLRHHELGLRQRAFGGVHQHDDAVDHVEDALDLAAEIGVAGRVDDVDARVFPDHARALGENGDAALALEVVRVHGPLGHLLVLAEGAGLLEQLVDQRRLAVVDVRDDGDVTNIHGCPGKSGRNPRLRTGLNPSANQLAKCAPQKSWRGGSTTWALIASDPRPEGSEKAAFTAFVEP